MRSLLRQAALLAACFVLPFPAAADDPDVPMYADRFVRALQQQRFDEAAAMFKPRAKQAPAATAAQLKRIGARIGGFAGMRNVLTLPNGRTLKLEVPSTALVPRPNSYHQLAYAATAADGGPVYYVLMLDVGSRSHEVLWFEIQLPTPDAASMQRAEQIVRDIN